MDALTPLPRSEWPSTSLRPMFLYDTNHPVTLDASVIAAQSGSTTTYLVTCPSSCAPSDFPEQTITHVSGSSWAGERTWAGATTRWGCKLGNGGGGILTDQYGWCTALTTKGGDITGNSKQRAINSCFVEARSVPVHITDGMDKLYKVDTYYDIGIDAEGLLSAWSETLKSMNCPITTATTEDDAEATSSAAEASKWNEESRTATATATTAAGETTADEAESTADETASNPAAETTTGSNGSTSMSMNKLVVIGSVLLGAWFSA
ncbi:hypothetical protein ACJ41O_008145 [Fusarium nematophilum]